MKKNNPDNVMRLATTLVRLDRKTFNASMCKQFPHLTTHQLRELYQQAKIQLAVEYVTRRRNDADED